VIGILPGRLATRQRLFVGALLVMAVSLFNLIALELGPFGSPWPIALLWPICGWVGLGPNVTTAGLLFGLGLWVDVLTGAPLGSWAFIALLTLGVLLLLVRFVGFGGLGPAASAIVTGVIMAITMILFGVWRGAGFYVLGSLLPLLTAVAAYPFVRKLFELSEDET
jgi:rod shape-determining protein MreD